MKIYPLASRRPWHKNYREEMMDEISTTYSVLRVAYLDRVELVDSWPEVGGITAEGDVK